ncbi:lysophospholipid acyltransferase family protein [Myxococcus sp. K15C18031901]|uniref:lysophospholipid acyltransferase family protein n=1 Tax=Myxococcus dinghuensis TaxID=2906761 RepID=UPI0020A6E992|nr:1-acyl-sn-glycerol-3-phosphate acyltransferase [Myxococcus dinghuensis]MCP3103716.1 lysophospholipid acyltransferase family protein [Myxococcus dinghuensis]
MIPDAKGGPFGWALDAYIGWKFRSAFRGLWVRGALPEAGPGRLVYLNHTNWWDGFMLHQLSRVAGWDGYCLMDEENLRRYRFLARIGAFSIRRKDAVSSVESLRHAKQLLRRPRAALYVFPEGEHRPFGELPLRLERGVELLARVGRVECVPIGVRYAFFEHERPDVLLEVGTPHPPGPMEVFQAGLESVVRRLMAVTTLDGFSRRVEGARGVAERWDAARGLSS